MLSIRGTNVYPRALEEIITGVPRVADHYEIHVTRENGNDQVEIKIEAEPSSNSSEYRDIEEDIQQEIKEAVGVTVEVQVLEPNELPRYELKARRFYDHRDAN